MKYTLICDESSTSNRHLILGSLIIPRHNHPLLVNEFKEWKQSNGFNPNSEFKWTKVSKKYLENYKDLTRWFFKHLNSNHFHFRAHVIDTAKRAYSDYGKGDKENSFYKVYYHLLYQSIKRLIEYKDINNVLILLDDKFDRYPFHLPILKKTLNGAIKRDYKKIDLIANVEPRKSSGENSEPMIQIVDVLIGAIGFVRNGFYSAQSSSLEKRELVDHIETLANTRLFYDTGINSAFNIWTFDVEKTMNAKKERKIKK